MRRVFLVLSIVLLLGALYFILMNLGNEVSVNVLYSNLLDAQTQAGWSDQGGFFVKTMNLALYTGLVMISGLFVGSGIVYMFLDAANVKVKAYERELEKTSVTGSNSASKVEVLEAKIKTLEKAFDTVIDERTQLELRIKNLNSEIENLNKGK